MPLTWLCSTTYLEEASDRVFEEYYDTCLDHFITQGWNVLRVMRILLNDIIRTHYISRDIRSLSNLPEVYIPRLVTSMV